MHESQVKWHAPKSRVVLDFGAPAVENLVSQGEFLFAVSRSQEGQFVICVFVGAHAACVWALIVVESAFVVARVRQGDEVFAVAESHEAGFFPVDFFLDYDGAVLEVGHEMFKKLLSAGKVVSPDAYAFAQSGFVRFHHRLIIEFVEPAVNVSFNVCLAPCSRLD